jgi:hypothetical protein
VERYLDIFGSASRVSPGKISVTHRFPMLPHPLQPLQPLLRCHGSWGYNPRWHKCRQHPKWSLGEMVSRNQPLPLAWKCPWLTEKGDDKNELQHMCKQRIFAIIFYRYTMLYPQSLREMCTQTHILIQTYTYYSMFIYLSIHSYSTKN